MSALAVARRKLAEITARAGKQTPDERNEVNAITSPAAPDHETSRVNLVSRVPPPLPPEADATPAETSLVNFVSLVEGPPRSALAGLSDCLMAALKAQAAAGDAGAARQAVALADYWAACDRGEVTLAATPGSFSPRDWNRMIDEFHRGKLAGKPPRKSPPALKSVQETFA